MKTFYSYHYDPFSKSGVVSFTGSSGESEKPRKLGAFSNRELAEIAFAKHYDRASKMAVVAGREVPAKFLV